MKQAFNLVLSISPRDRRRAAFWSAPAERSGDGALAWRHPRHREQKRSRASLASALQIEVGLTRFVAYPAASTVNMFGDQI